MIKFSHKDKFIPHISPMYKKGAGFIFRALLLLLIFAFSFHQIAYAARRSAGGGDLAKFDTGKWAAGTVIGLASFTVGSALAGGIASGISGAGFASGLTAASPLSLSNWATNYNVMTATKYTGKAIGSMGQYYGWNPKATLVASSVIGGAVAGGLNPAGYGVSGTLNGMTVGTISGAIEGGILAGMANKKGELQPWMGPVAGLASGMATGFITGGFTPQGGQFFFANTFNPKNAFTSAIGSTINSIPSTAINIGVNYLAEQSKNPQDQYMIRQAFSGIHPIVNSVAHPDNFMEKIVNDQGKVIGVKPGRYYQGYSTQPRSSQASSGIQSQEFSAPKVEPIRTSFERIR